MIQQCPLRALAAKCGGTRRDPHGTIASPNYPDAYESNMDCEYRINLDVNRRVRLDFDVVNLRRQNTNVGAVEPVAEYDDTLRVFDYDPFKNICIYMYIMIT